MYDKVMQTDIYLPKDQHQGNQGNKIKFNER